MKVPSVTVENLKNERTTPITMGIKNAMAKQTSPGRAKSAKYF
jgi:hypothetical protein